MSPLTLNGEIEPLDPKLSETSPKKGPGSVENTIRRNRIRVFPELSVGPGRCSGVWPWNVSGIVLH